MGEHDVTYRTLFSHRHLVASLIRGFLPKEWADGLDVATLEPVSEVHATEDWQLRHNDCVWRLRWRGDGRWIYVYLMLEFQRTDETFMAVRILSYEGVLYQHLIKALELKQGELPPVVPIVIYNGEAPWSSATEFSDLLSPAPSGMSPYLPRLRFLLIDVLRLPQDELERMESAVACLFRLESSAGLARSASVIDDLSRLLDRQEHSVLRYDFKRWLCEILLPRRLPGVSVPEVRMLEEVGSMLKEHTLDWTAEWRMAGREEGRQEGRKEGRKEGRQEGEATLLLRLLERKFGALDRRVLRRIRRAEAETLLEWGERLLTAKSLAEVFGDRG